ncbi:MAG: hypothetical protein ACI87E_000231 [Mariniblastus sp.]|jgi:hypothetical protein
MQVELLSSGTSRGILELVEPRLCGFDERYSTGRAGAYWPVEKVFMEVRNDLVCGPRNGLGLAFR